MSYNCLDVNYLGLLGCCSYHLESNYSHILEQISLHNNDKFSKIVMNYCYLV